MSKRRKIEDKLFPYENNYVTLKDYIELRNSIKINCIRCSNQVYINIYKTVTESKIICSDCKKYSLDNTKVFAYLTSIYNRVRNELDLRNSFYFKYLNNTFNQNKKKKNK